MQCEGILRSTVGIRPDGVGQTDTRAVGSFTQGLFGCTRTLSMRVQPWRRACLGHQRPRVIEHAADIPVSFEGSC